MHAETLKDILMHPALTLPIITSMDHAVSASMLRSLKQRKLPMPGSV
jgi:hypothetical protein